MSNDTRTVTRAVAKALLDHVMGPGGRCACGRFVADGDFQRLANHLADAILAALPTSRSDDRETIEALAEAASRVIEAIDHTRRSDGPSALNYVDPVTGTEVWVHKGEQ